MTDFYLRGVALRACERTPFLSLSFTSFSTGIYTKKLHDLNVA